jgi:hypothetical protein
MSLPSFGIDFVEKILTVQFEIGFRPSFALRDCRDDEYRRRQIEGSEVRIYEWVFGPKVIGRFPAIGSLVQVLCEFADERKTYPSDNQKYA